MEMKRKANNVENETLDNKISLFDERIFPKIAEKFKDLTDTEKRAIEVMVSKEPYDTWEETAMEIGISTRQLYNIRQNEVVQEACYLIAKTLFKSDIPDVYKTLTRKAKEGEGWAVKLFLGLAGELPEQGQNNSMNVMISNTSDLNEKARKTLEEMEKMSAEELQKDIYERLKL